MDTTKHRTSRRLNPTDRVLRIINILTFIPGLALLIATGVTRRKIWAFVGIAPLSLSAILSVFVLLIGPQPRNFIALLDLFLAAFTLGIDIWGWADRPWWRRRHDGTLSGHASSALLIQFCIHAFFVLRAISHHANARQLLSACNPFGSRHSCAKCPHCQNEARSKKTDVKAVGGKETHHRVIGRDDGYDEEVDGSPSYHDARPSTDDENARLV